MFDDQPEFIVTDHEVIFEDGTTLTLHDAPTLTLAVPGWVWGQPINEEGL